MYKLPRNILGPLALILTMGWLGYLYISLSARKEILHQKRCVFAMNDSHTAMDTLKVVRLDPSCVIFLMPK